jgi:hypothetical protein
MRKLLLVLAALSALSPVRAQSYQSLMVEAAAHRTAKEHTLAVAVFERAFGLPGAVIRGNDFYVGACSAARAGRTELAFDWLEKAAAAGWMNPQNLQGNPDLASLHELPRWAGIVATMKAGRKALDAKIDKPLREQLRAVLVEDQKYRMQLDEVEKKSGRDSAEVKELWKTINAKDAENLAKITAILDTRGWLGPDIVGNDGASALFLVIQHADLKTQQKYLPMMRAAVKAKQAEGSSLALLEDRVALGEGRRQVYGSQIGIEAKTGKHYVSPLDDPEGVDARRAGVGLMPLADYVKNWGLVWDPVEYKKQLPELEKRER